MSDIHECAHDFCKCPCCKQRYCTSCDESIEDIQKSEIDRIRAENERLKAEREWIPVSERLPERSDFYIVYPEPKYVDGVCYFNKEMDCRGHEPNTFETESEYGEVVQHRGITHWMPLPEPPKDK